MTLRTRILIIIGGIVVALLVIYGIVNLFQRSQTTEEVSEQQTGQTQDIVPTEEQAFEDIDLSTVPSVEVGPSATPTENPINSEESKLVAIATPFTERIGSYSNQSRFENLQAILPAMTDEMRTWAQGRIDEAQGKPIEELYKGYNTQVISYKIPVRTASNATLVMTTQRTEMTGTTTNAQVYNQDMRIELIKVNGAWLVDNAVWIE